MAAPSNAVPAGTERAAVPAAREPASHSDRASRPAATFAIVLAFVLLATAAYEAAGLWRFLRGHERPPLWDMAGHGWQGVELLDDLVRVDPLRFVVDLNRQDKWPFGGSLLLVPFLAAGERSWSAATAAGVVLFALFPTLLVWAGWEAGRLRSPERAGGDPDDLHHREAGWTAAAGAAAGGLAAALVLGGPLMRLLSIVVLREVPGAAATVVALALYLRAVRCDTVGGWRAAALGTLALLLVKWNYGLVFALGAGLHELVRADRAGRRAVAATLRPWAWPWTGAAPGPDATPAPRWIRLAVWVVGIAAVVLLATGRNPGSVLYGALVIAAFYAAPHLVGARRIALRERWRTLAARTRGVLGGLVLPLAVWSLSPSPIHPRTVLDFLRNRPGEPMSIADALLVYPRTLASEYLAHPWFAILVAFGVVAALVVARRPGGVRAVAIVAATSAVLVALHPYREPRFLAATVPLLALAAALGLVGVVGRAGRPWLAAVVAATAAVVIAGLAVADPRLDVAVAQRYPLYSGTQALRPALAAIPAQLGDGGAVAIVGVANELAPDLVRWELARTPSPERVEVFELPRRFRAMGLGRERPSAAEAEGADGGSAGEKAEVRARRQALAQWLDDEGIDRVLAVVVERRGELGTSVDFSRHNAWQQPFARDLDRLPGWRRTKRLDVPELDMGLRFHERVGPSGEPRERRGAGGERERRRRHRPGANG